MLVDVIMKMRILLDTILLSGLRLPDICEYQIGWVHSFNRHFLSTPSSNIQNRQDLCHGKLVSWKVETGKQIMKRKIWRKVSSAVEKNKAGKRGTIT